MKLNAWTERIWQDLQPTPGRLSSTVRIVLTTVITLILLMTLRVPFASIGLYFVFIVGRDSPSVTLRSGVFSAITLALSSATVIGVVSLTENDPMARVLSVAIVAFIAALLSVATTLPALPSTWGFIYCTLIALWEGHAPADTSVKNCLWLLAATGVPLVCSIAVEFIFSSRKPVDELMKERRMRYEALEAMFRLYAEEEPSNVLAEAKLRVARLAAAGQSGMQRLYNTIVDSDADPGALPIGARVRITMLAQLMDVSAAFAAFAEGPGTQEVRSRCAAIADVCRELSRNISPQIQSPLVLSGGEASTLLQSVERVLQDILSMPAGPQHSRDRSLIALPSKRVPYFIPGGLTNKDNVAFALKLSLCATLCYVLYFAVDWPGIGTSVTTVFITGLSTTGAIKQKFIYRLLGSVIGGLVLGIGATAFLFPYMDSITSLVVLIGVVTAGAAWIAGGRRFNYVGLQIAFSFYLVALEGFSAPTELAPARDRFMGILLALLVMWFVFDRVWPVRTVTAMRRALATLLTSDAALFRMEQDTAGHEERLRNADALRDRMGKLVASLRTMNDEVAYEFGVDRELHARSSQAILKAAFASVALFWNELAILHKEQDWSFRDDPTLAGMRHQIAASMDQMAESVAERKSYSVVNLSDTIPPALLETPGFGEYAQNAVSRFQEVQTNVASLSGLA